MTIIHLVEVCLTEVKGGMNAAGGRLNQVKLVRILEAALFQD